ncbi:tripartite tricarboxylate transporter TctB family protein [Paenibacillus turpanensis]|uniref:tripartite tricarboxylate transporter TctB family protein n=1 Tax=Paenibacillus turpanensis TaxID=2689078 RepID=UPI00140AAA1B|nr:tripartite tricarboxylate transporter TctB family protein [Paenibacillus turpanensis]
MAKRLLHQDTVGGFITAGFGVFSIFEAVKQYPNRMNIFVGDHTFPALIGVAMIVLGLVLVALKDRGEKFTVDFPSGKAMRNLCIVIGLLFLYYVLLPVLGYVLSTFLLLVTLFKIIGDYGVLKSALFGSVSIIALYLLFIYWLQMPFPDGIFGW